MYKIACLCTMYVNQSINLITASIALFEQRRFDKPISADCELLVQMMPDFTRF